MTIGQPVPLGQPGHSLARLTLRAGNRDIAPVKHLPARVHAPNQRISRLWCRRGLRISFLVGTGTHARYWKALIEEWLTKLKWSNRAIKKTCSWIRC